MVCSVCGHRTKRADHLRQHVRKKHPEIALRSLFRRRNNSLSVNSHENRSGHNDDIGVAGGDSMNSILQQQLQQHQDNNRNNCSSNVLAALNLKTEINAQHHQLHYDPNATSNSVVDLDDDDDDDDDYDEDLILDRSDNLQDTSGGTEHLDLTNDNSITPPPCEEMDVKASNANNATTASGSFYHQRVHALQQLQQHLKLANVNALDATATTSTAAATGAME